MSNYTKTTNFGAKDTLPSGDSQKIIRGTEFDTEFNNIATAVATKLEVDGSNNLALSGTLSATKLIPTGGTATGNGLYLPAANTLAFSVNSTEAVRVNSSGNVGIKTSTPQNDLDVFNSSGSTRIGIRATESISRSPELTFLFGTDANSNNNTLGFIRATPTQVDPSPLKSDLLFATNTGDSVITAMRLDSSGNLGFNFLPSTWISSFKAIQLQGSSLYANGFNNINLSTNVAGGVDASGNGGLYGNTQAAARYQQVNGAHMWFTAPSGTTGTAITFLERMILNNDGHLGLGHSPAFAWGTGIGDAKALQLGDGYASGSIASDAPYGFFNVLHNVRWDGTNWIYTAAAAGSRYYTYRGDGAHVFETAPVGTGSTAATLTERLRIRQSGNTQITSTSGGSPVNTQDTAALRLRSTATAGVDVGPVVFFEGQTGNATADYGFGAIQGMKLSATAADYSGGLAFFTQGVGGNTALNEAMRVTPTGLGVGTSSPQVELHVNSGAVSEVARFEGNSNPFITLYDTTVRQFYIQSTSTDINLWGTTNKPIRIATNNTERMRITSGGFVIGTTSTLTNEYVRVAGASHASILFDNAAKTNGSFFGVFNDAALIGVNRNPTTGLFYDTNKYSAQIACSATTSDSFISFATSTAANVIPTTRMFIDASGNVGIGTTSTANAKVSVSSGTHNLELDVISAVSYVSSYDRTGSTWKDLSLRALNLVLVTNANERARIKSTGQVRFVPLSADPAGAEAGDVYYNSTSNKLKVYNGTAWVDLH